MGNSKSKEAEFTSTNVDDVVADQRQRIREKFEQRRKLEILKKLRLANQESSSGEIAAGRSAKYLVRNSYTPEPAETYVAEYEFTSTGVNQLALPKGSIVELIKSNATKEWCEVKMVRSGAKGWVPRCFITPSSSLEANDWYHGDVDRATTNFLLSGGEDGTFLIRKGISRLGSWSLSVLSDGVVGHYRVSNDLEGSFYIDSDKKFSSLRTLVRYYSTNKVQSSSVCLLHPAPKKRKPTVYSLSPNSDDWEINSGDLKDLTKIGEGGFGVVKKGTWTKFNKIVAVKTIKEELSKSVASDEFKKEAEIMKSIKHPHLVQLLGICTSQQPHQLISEFMCNGDLGSYLRQKEEKDVTWVGLLHMALQVTMGMEFLEERNYFHRDLAARNCFVGENNLVKVGDFGLSRILPKGVIYQGGANCKFPFHWTAPEGLLQKQFTSKSDVWSFGVLLWEISTLGKKQPYGDIPPILIIVALQRGERLPCPENCPKQVYEVMKECWELEPDERPTFAKLRLKLNAISDIFRPKHDLSISGELLMKILLLALLKAHLED